MDDSRFGWDLPPGVRESDIPGNRPDDVLWDEVTDSVTKEDIQEACFAHRLDCEYAEFTDCYRCNGTGKFPAGQDCARCGGTGMIFTECSRNVVDASGLVQPYGYIEDCTQFDEIVTNRFYEAKEEQR